jgi:hypothetical protein
VSSPSRDICLRSQTLIEPLRLISDIIDAAEVLVLKTCDALVTLIFLILLGTTWTSVSLDVARKFPLLLSIKYASSMCDHFATRS